MYSHFLHFNAPWRAACFTMNARLVLYNIFVRAFECVTTTRIPFAAEMICVRVPDEGLSFMKNRVWRGNFVASCTAATGAYIVGASVFVLCRLIRLGPVKITSRNDDAFVRGAEYTPLSDLYNTRTSHDVYVIHSVLYKTVYSCKSVVLCQTDGLNVTVVLRNKLVILHMLTIYFERVFGSDLV